MIIMDFRCEKVPKHCPLKGMPPRWIVRAEWDGEQYQIVGENKLGLRITSHASKDQFRANGDALMDAAVIELAGAFR